MSVGVNVLEFRSGARDVPSGADEKAPVVCIPFVQPHESSGEIDPDSGEDNAPAVWKSIGKEDGRLRRLLPSNDEGTADSESDKPRSPNAERAAVLCTGETTDSVNGCDKPLERSISSDEIGEKLAQPLAVVDDIAAVGGNPCIPNDRLSKALLPVNKDEVRD